MPNNPKKRGKKAERTTPESVPAIRVPIEKAAKISSQEVEAAIRKALSPIKSNVFRGRDELVIVLETFKPHHSEE